MDLTRETQQREEFRNILFELSKSQEKLQEASYRIGVYKRLEQLYDAELSEKRFRHFYSDIFSVLTQIKENPEQGDINILGQNLDVIRNGYQAKNIASDGERIIDVSDAINKLYDHVNLDIARMSYSDAKEWQKSGGYIQNLSEQTKVMQNRIDEMATNIENAEEKITNQQKEYISILGIFSSVVLAFSGGIAFSTSVLDNIMQASVYRTLIVGLVVGLVLVNVIFGLFYYINGIVSKEERIKPLIVSNVIIVLLIVVVIIAWAFGVVEYRDECILENNNPICSQDESSEI